MKTGVMGLRSQSLLIKAEVKFNENRLISSGQLMESTIVILYYVCNTGDPIHPRISHLAKNGSLS